MAIPPKVKLGADFFLKEDNSEFHYVGFSDFGQWKRFNMIDGPELLVRPLWVERRSIADAAGYTDWLVARVFRYANPTNPFGIVPEPSLYNKVNAFIELAAEYKIYIDFTTGDSDVVLPGVQNQQNDLNLFTSFITRFCFIETCNEPTNKQNGNLPRNGVKPSPSPNYLRDSGDYGDIGSPSGWPYQTILDYVSYHGNRETYPGPRFPKWIIDMNDQAAVIRSNIGRPTVLKEPNGFDTFNQPGRRYNDPYLAKLLGQMIAYCGQCFHSQLGLESNGFDDPHKIAFGNYCTGVVGGLR